MITDFQKLSEREDDPIIKQIIHLNNNDNKIIDFTKSLFSLLNLMKKRSFSKRDLKMIIKNSIQIFLFKKFVIKDICLEKLVEKNSVPKEIIKEFESYVDIDKKKVKDEIFRQDNIVPKKDSNLDKWIKNEFLKKVKKYVRGVVGYRVHARFASNNGTLKNTERFKKIYSNFHWDYALNAMPYVIYLSNVKKGDGEFKILESSINFNQNLYLSFYDFIISSKNGINESLMSNRVGSHLNNEDQKKIEKDIKFFDGSKGTAIFFSGRHIIHCGGYPEINRNRLSIFLSHKNYLMAIINNSLKIIDFL